MSHRCCVHGYGIGVHDACFSFNFFFNPRGNPGTTITGEEYDSSFKRGKPSRFAPNQVRRNLFLTTTYWLGTSFVISFTTTVVLGTGCTCCEGDILFFPFFYHHHPRCFPESEFSASASYPIVLASYVPGICVEYGKWLPSNAAINSVGPGVRIPLR